MQRLEFFSCTYIIVQVHPALLMDYEFETCLSKETEKTR